MDDVTRRRMLLGAVAVAGLSAGCLSETDTQGAVSEHDGAGDENMEVLEQLIIGNAPTGRPLISNEDTTVYVDPESGDDSAAGTEDEPLQTIQEAVSRIPIYLRHHYVIDLATVPNTPVTYDEDVLVPAFIGTGQARTEDGAPESGPVFNVELRGESGTPDAVQIGSIMFANVSGVSAGHLIDATITRDCPYSNEESGICIYGTGEVNLYEIQFSDGPTHAITAYGAKVKASFLDFGENNVEMGIHAKRHASVMVEEVDGITDWRTFNVVQNSLVTIKTGNRVEGSPTYRTRVGGRVYDQEMTRWIEEGRNAFTPAGDTEVPGTHFSEDGNVTDAGSGTIWYADGKGELEEGFYGMTSGGPVQLG